MASQPGKSRKVSGVIGVASVILVIVTLLAGAALQFTGLSGAASANAQPSGTVAFDPGADLVPDEAKCLDNSYIKSSSQTVKVGDNKFRQFATAVSIPYKGTTDAEVSAETVAEICGNTTELKMVVDDMMLWSGFPGAEENKVWVKKIQDDLNTKGLDSFVLKVKDTKKLIVTDQFQEYAGWVNAVLLRFNTNGEQSLTSVRNWEIPATSDPATQPIAVQASDPESKPSRVRTLMDKNGKCLYKIGFNAEDKRIETFNCEVPAPPTTKTPPGTPSCVVTATHKCTTPPTPGCKEKHNCYVPPKCTVPTKCLTPKDPKNDTTPPAGTVPLGPDPVQPVAPAPKPDPLKPTTPVTADPGPSVPVQGATPAPVSTPAPVATQAPAPSDPGTPVKDAG